MGSQQGVHIVPVRKAEPDLSKLAQALLVMVAELATDEEAAPKDDHDGGA